MYSTTLHGIGSRQQHDTTEIATRRSVRVDALSLEQHLQSRLQGEVRFDDGSRALYATDGSNYRQVPIGVVIPRTIDDVVETVAACRHFHAPILSRGGGTSLAGQCCNVAVVMDFSKYLHQIIALDPASRTARVQPGIVLDELRRAAEAHKLTFGPDPATHSRCTLGGMIGNNSCGIHSEMSGRTADNIEELEILTIDGARLRVGRTSPEQLEQYISAGGRRGEIYARLRALSEKYGDIIRERYPRIPRRVSGYNLDELLPENGFNVARALVGSEGTCVVVLEATTRLVASPSARSLLILGYPDIFAAGKDIMTVKRFHPIGLEGLDKRFVEDMIKKHLHPDDLELMPPGGGHLLIEFGGETKEESDAQARKLMEELKRRDDAPSMKLFDNPRQERMIWEIRESGLGATAFVPGQPVTWEGWEDSAVAPEDVPGYLQDLRKLLEKYGYEGALYGHFGQGCIHTRLNFDLETSPGIEKWKRFMAEATDLIDSYHGSYSGEHGDGQSRAEFLSKMFGSELNEAFREFKSIWDPPWLLNPGKVVDPYPIDQNLRLGRGYNPPDVKTHFHFMDDHGSFAHAALRCVGAGVCRRKEGGTMCPSYMVTHEEKHSTRGRARLLFEMLQGQVIGKKQWQDESVKDALDLCLSCKGCKGDCPVHVDMATYKAEFLSHYYEKQWRPRQAYAFGLVPYWARIGSMMPNVVNFFAELPVVSQLAKLAVGMDQRRRIPQFASKSFVRSFRRNRPKTTTKGKVVLWPDTFNNYFHPATAHAAAEVLEHLGFHVALPKRHVCCGRPLYDYGVLDLAKKFLLHDLHVLRQDIRAGTPIVVLEPSCAAVFKDELINLLPSNEDAKRLRSQTYLLSDFIEKFAPDADIPKLDHAAVVHGHCHHKSLLGFGAEEKVLQKLGLRADLLDSGCCGMAGAFGFEAGDHYDVAMKCGERVLLPRVRKAPKSTFIIADGFSCREQIVQSTDRRALHLADVLKLAIDGAPAQATDYPERLASPPGRRSSKWGGLVTFAVLAFASIGGWRAFRNFRHNRRERLHSCSR